MMLVFLSILLLGVGSRAAPQPQAQDACVYVDEDKNVVLCAPTSKTVCVAKTRYEPEEYLDDECTTTTEQVCKKNYDTVVQKYNTTECKTTYTTECTQLPGERGVIT